MRLRKNLQKFSTHFHSVHDVVLFIRIFLLITVLPLLIKTFSIPQLMQALTPRMNMPRNRPGSPDIEERIVGYTEYILSRNFWIYKNTCLKRSLTLYHFFRSMGTEVQICFGVRKKDTPDATGRQDIEGHAWLLNNGELFRERNAEAQTFRTTYCFPERN